MDESSRLLQGSPYRDDDGTADPDLVAALTALAVDPRDHDRRSAALAALGPARLLVPVVAVLGETEQRPVPGGGTLTSDKSSDMAVVLLTRPDGDRALLAFTGAAAMRAWNPEARPVPVPTHLAAATAVQEGAAALVVDLAGPHRLVVADDELTRFAAGFRVVRGPDGWAWIGRSAE